MAGLIKEEIFTTIKKKRFILLTTLLFAGAIARMIYAKTGYFNDLTSIFAMRSYLNNAINPLAGAVLLFSIYRRKYTKTSILQAEEHGAKRSTAVIARAAAGSIILAVCYVLMAVLLVLMGVILGAHLSAARTGMFLTELFSDCIVAVTLYVGVLFWLYLIPFPFISMAVYAALFWLPYLLFIESDILDNIVFKVCTYILPKCGMSVFAAGLSYGAPDWIYPLICIGYIVLTLLLTILVFKLKKIKEKKKKGEEEADAAQETAPVTDVFAPADGKEST